MALTVHPAFCADGHARQPECRAGGHRPLVIHGLWPERNEPRTYPHDCPAPPLDLDAALALELADFMPGMADGLHEHEWREHGGCSGLDDDEYYRHALELARGVDAALGARLTTLAGERDHGGRAARDRGPVSARARRARSPSTAARCATRGSPGSRYLIEVRQCVDNDGPSGAPGRRSTAPP